MTQKTLSTILLLIHSIAFAPSANAFRTLYKNPKEKEAIFKACADYVTLVTSGQCPKPTLKRSARPFEREGILGVRSIAKFYGIAAYTEKSDTLLNVNKMCQVGLHACASIKDTGFGGGEKACASVCTTEKCNDPYIYYACKATSQTTDPLDGRKVCSEKSVEKCFIGKDKESFNGAPFPSAFKDYNLATLEKLKEPQSEQDAKILNWILNEELLHMVNHFEEHGRHEFNPKEILYFDFPETIKEAAIEMEDSIKKSFKEKGKELARFIREFYDAKKPAPYGPENDKKHQKLWGEKALSNDLKTRISSLLRGLNDRQAYEIKKIVTDLNSVRLKAEDRYKLLEVVVRLTKDHFGKSARNYGDFFAKSKKVNLWRTIARSVSFTYGLERRLQVLRALNPLSEYQLLQVVHYNKFHEIYPDDLPKEKDLLKKLENVTKLDVRYSDHIPDYLIGIELSDQVLDSIIGSPVYSSKMRELIIDFYKKTAKPDFTSPKKYLVYRAYKPSNKFKKFLNAISFLNNNTEDFYNVPTYNNPPEAEEKLEALKMLSEMPEAKLDKLVSEAFLEELKASLPTKKVNYRVGPIIGLDRPPPVLEEYTAVKEEDFDTGKFISYQAVLKKLNESS